MLGGGQPQELDQPPPPKVAERRLNWARKVPNNSHSGDDYTTNNQQHLRISNKSHINLLGDDDDNNRQYINYSQDKETTTTTRKAQEMQNVLQFSQKNLQQKYHDQQQDDTNYDHNNINCLKDHERSNEDDSQELLSEALLAVASAEEYAAKITKLQQACLTPLKEDLADWLNKIMNMSSITKENFMDKLDNGVIICRMAKIISVWCYQQLQRSEDSIPQQQQLNTYDQNNLKTHSQQTDCQNNIHHINHTKSREMGSLLSISTRDVSI